MDRQLDFFMGALSPVGFTGYFPQLQQQADWTLYLLKAGPGCGKSTLMRGLAERAPGTVERIHCSSDPDSLDGVIFWEKKAAVLDATAPHTLEPSCPGAKDQVISLYEGLDAGVLRPQREEIAALFARCGSLQKHAGHCVTVAAALLEENRSFASETLCSEKARHYARGLAARFLPDRHRPGTEWLRMLGATTLKGSVVYRTAVSQLADRIVVFHDEYGAAAALILQVLRDAALAKGHHIITCRSPLEPQHTVLHLLLPELHLAFLTSDSRSPFRFDGQKNVWCTRFMDQDALQAHRQKMHFHCRAARELLAQTSALQMEAKHQHDRLEHLYQNAFDFACADAALERIAAELKL